MASSRISLCRIAYHEILLVDTKHSSFFIAVIRIEEQSQVFGNIGLIKGDSLAPQCSRLQYPYQKGEA